MARDRVRVRKQGTKAHVKYMHNQNDLVAFDFNVAQEVEDVKPKSYKEVVKFNVVLGYVDSNLTTSLDTGKSQTGYVSSFMEGLFATC